MHSKKKLILPSLFLFQLVQASSDIDIISIVATNDLVQPSYLGKLPPVVKNESHSNRQRNSKHESLIMYICQLLPVSLVPYCCCYMIDTTKCNEGNYNQHQRCNSCNNAAAALAPPLR